MRALVTNDDGIESDGLRHLALAAVAAGLDVTVVAPRSEASGTSAAVTAVEREGRIVVEPRSLPGLEHVPSYAVTAAPGFIVRIAHRGAFGDSPDLVLSGINRGANTGRSIIHSGTVGAALTAATQGSSGLAVSLAIGLSGVAPPHWETAADVVRHVLPLLLELAPPVVLNLNVPDLEASEIRGVVRAPLATAGVVQTTVTEAGHGFIRIGLAESTTELESGTDVALLADGYATVTPVEVIRERGDVDLARLDALMQAVP